VRSRLGAAAVRSYVDAFDYGNRGLPSVTGVTGVNDTVALSELSPTLRISPIEQTVFLRKVVNRRLPISAHAYDMTARLLKVETLANGWEVYGKTGTAHTRLPDGSEDSIGWFVGWANKGGRTLVFARLLEQPVRTDGYGGPLTRDAFLSELARSTL
jgi:beta-lactamase class D